MTTTLQKYLKSALVASAAGFALSLAMTPAAFAEECLLDTSHDGFASNNVDTDGGAVSSGSVESLACGNAAIASGLGAVALGGSSDATQEDASALGALAKATGARSSALGSFAEATMDNATAVGHDAQATGFSSTALGVAANAEFDNSIAIGVQAATTEADQVVIKSADTFTILGNGNVGLGTATPSGNLEINSGMGTTRVRMINSAASWELRNSSGSGQLILTNTLAGTRPIRIHSRAANGLLRVGVTASGQIDINGDLFTLGTVTTGGPLCNAGCDAVFDADYDLPSIEEHAAQMFANRHLPAVGPTIPLAPINLSERYGNLLNELEKAHIYIAQQQAEIKAVKAEKQEMKSEIVQTQERLARLENLLLE